jgi:hypothetical protein
MPMKRIALPLTLIFATALVAPALAEPMEPVPVIAPGHTLLTLDADGKIDHAPDLAVFNAGVTTQGKTAAEALGANSAAMSRVIAALSRTGIADRDIQTSNLGINPVYSEPRRMPDGSTEPRAPEIVGYQVNNSVTVRQRQPGNYGKVIDTLVNAGANQVSGPSFQIDKPDVVLDEARTEAIAKARGRAELYARAAGLRVVRIVSISESGGRAPPVPMYRMAVVDAVAAAAPPVVAGEVSLSTNVTVQFELAP